VLQRNLPDDVIADVTIINEEALRTARIVQNLLTFARKQPEGKVAVDLNEQLRRVVTLRNHEQNVNNIKVVLNLAPDLPLVMGNSSQLQQVFFNIIVNAEQAMLDFHEKGTITITTQNRRGQVTVTIADDGPGIAPENMSRLFTPFFTTKEIGKGTGLGLSICHGIISEHEGRIYAESEYGKGTAFIIELPAKLT